MPEALIGIAGYAGAGKDTLADLLVEHFSFVKIAFADPMREIAAAINPIVGVMGTDNPSEDEIIRYSDALEFHGYTEAKALYPEMRQFLQRLGTEAGRNILGTDFWVDLAMKRAQAHRRVVLSDMRFQNEAQAVKAAGGRTIRIQRPGVVALNDHASEHDLDVWGFDLFMQNNSRPIDMLTRLEQFFGRSYTQVLRIS
jgi:hypothetical protein